MSPTEAMSTAKVVQKSLSVDRSENSILTKATRGRVIYFDLHLERASIKETLGILHGVLQASISQ